MDCRLLIIALKSVLIIFENFNFCRFYGQKRHIFSPKEVKNNFFGRKIGKNENFQNKFLPFFKAIKRSLQSKFYVNRAIFYRVNAFFVFWRQLLKPDVNFFVKYRSTSNVDNFFNFQARNFLDQSNESSWSHLSYYFHNK